MSITALDQWKLPADPAAAMEAATKQYVDAGDAPTIPVKVVTATTYTMIAADAGYELQFPNGCAVTMDASVFPAGSVGLLRQTGTFGVTVSTGAAVRYPSGIIETAGHGYMFSWRVDSSTLVYINGESAS